MGAFPETSRAERQPRVWPRRAAASTTHRTRHGRVARAGAAQRSARIFAPGESGGGGREWTGNIPKQIKIRRSRRRFRKSYDSALRARWHTPWRAGTRRARSMGTKRKRCTHGRAQGSCADCNPCPHGKVKYDCADCNPCPHGRLKRKCADCNPCPHGRLRGRCADCNPCPHGKLKSKCADCNHCPHGKLKSRCLDCNPCPHGKWKHRCAACKSARAEQPVAREVKPDPEVKLEHPEVKPDPEVKREPLTIRGDFGLDE